MTRMCLRIGTSAALKDLPENLTHSPGDLAGAFGGADGDILATFDRAAGYGHSPIDRVQSCQVNGPLCCACGDAPGAFGGASGDVRRPAADITSGAGFVFLVLARGFRGFRSRIILRKQRVNGEKNHQNEDSHNSASLFYFRADAGPETSPPQPLQYD